MTRANGQRFRDMVLSKGSTMKLDELYREWRGRDPSVEPLLETRGLKPKTETAPESGSSTSSH